MFKLFALEPDVGGGWGPETAVTNHSEYRAGIAAEPNITYLEYEFEDWFGDDLLTSFPCFIVSERLANAIKAVKLKGIALQTMKVSISDNLIELQPDLYLPNFVRMIPQGNVQFGNNEEISAWDENDACIARYSPALDHRGMRRGKYFLVVSERFKDLLSQFNIDRCQVLELQC